MGLGLIFYHIRRRDEWSLDAGRGTHPSGRRSEVLGGVVDGVLGG